MADETYLVQLVRVIAESLQDVPSAETKIRNLQDTAVEHLRQRLALAVADALPGNSAAEARQIVTLAWTIVTSNPSLIRDPSRITAGALIKEQDDALTSVGSVSPGSFGFIKRLPPISDGLKESIRSAVVTLVLNAPVTYALAAWQVASNEQQQQVVRVVVTGDDVNLRMSPSLEAAVIGKLSNGSAAVLIADDQEWTQVRVTVKGTEKVGWIATKYLKSV